ncbi:MULTISPECIES: (Fe-S)-binding protein [unclassified Actinomyces]|uniref:(Fe-S)-binding protein n=1 Tax=unclassified Actinomyces TaxID=2609248 RepID=UPI001373C899|nr:(Fe-S)-binding protein [Actinomyces sp. 432]NDR54732.1 (Fe-S)-binding protein [Actinomyces sp. 565]QHO91746.1 (Fe-S)-binding protein [Actinomyces sp. 432]
MRVALFATCLADTMFPQAAQATVSILERLGHEVVFPQGQACCGQMHANTGYFKQAASIVANHVKTFEPVLDGEWDAVVVPSGSCAGAARHEQRLVAEHVGDSSLVKRVDALSNYTYDISEFLIDVLGLEDVGAYFPHTVTYHPTCHSMRVAHVGDRPYRLLRAVEGLTLIELPDEKVCCGFGGTFSIKNSDTSTAMVADKAANVMSTGAEVLCTGDYSCLMNIGGALSRVNSGVRVMHLAEILASTKEAPFEGHASFQPSNDQVRL